MNDFKIPSQKTFNFNGKTLSKKWIENNIYEAKSRAGIPETWVDVNGQTIMVIVTDDNDIVIPDYYTGKNIRLV